METDKTKYRYIFSLRLAGFLMQKGFRIRRIHKNLDDETRDVYLFNDSEGLRSAIKEYEIEYSNR